ncbi:MAG: GntR family transcriptional regulator [Chloroflexi bacterium]|nr:GntR family transcriptional regulator [Chloroflexota bacterium]
MRALDFRTAKTSFVDAAYRAILDAILSHEFKPGERLSPNDLAAQLGLSRSPVDRALERLAGEALVELRPGRGPYVAEPTVSELLEFYELRSILEEQAAQRGISRVNDAFLARMEELIASESALMAQRDGTYEWQRNLSAVDRDIHRHVVSLWPNRKAQAWYQQANMHIKSFLLLKVAGAYSEKSVEEHRGILEALRARDGNAAVAAVRRHRDTSRTSFLARLREAGLEIPDRWDSQASG